MTPVWMIEGGATTADAILDDVPSASERSGNGAGHLEERRLSALAEAVRDHESTGRHQAMAARPQDLALYRRLRQICGQG